MTNETTFPASIHDLSKLRLEIHKDGDKFYYDHNNNIVRIEQNNGYCADLVYDANNLLLKYEDSNSYWCKYIRDEEGIILTYEESEIGLFTLLVADKDIGLYYTDKLYYCTDGHCYTYAQALEYFGEESQSVDKVVNARGYKFVTAIVNNNQNLPNPE